MSNNNDGHVESVLKQQNQIVKFGGNNNGVFDIAKGTVAFVAAQVAKTGNMQITTPTATLGIHGTTHGAMTGRMLEGVEAAIFDVHPDIVLVPGDTDSTLAGALAAAKLQVPVVHLEAGLRSFNRAMPEEINRVLTDSISDMLFTTEPAGNENLAREGVSAERIHFVGNVMIDTLFRYRERARASKVLETLAVDSRAYSLLTLHRPSNVDSDATLRGLLEAVARIQEVSPVVFPVHPRTRQRLDRLDGELPSMPNLRLADPLPDPSRSRLPPKAFLRTRARPESQRRLRALYPD